MQLSSNGLQFIKSFEGFDASPYLDGAKIPTIGYGTIMYPDGSSVTISDSDITEDQALQYLQFEVNQKTASVNNMVTASINQNQFDALVSFTYNEGVNALRTSTLLRLLNNGDVAGAADQFPVWDKIRVDGVLQESDGLLRRRNAEQQLFLTPC
jgi:lysozyme